HAHELGDIGSVRSRVEAEHSCVRIWCMEGIDRVAKAALFPYLLKQARGHAAAEDIGEYLQAVEIRILLQQPVHGERNVSLFEIPRLDTGAADEVRWLRNRCTRADETGEFSLDLGDHRAVIDRASGSDDHLGRAIVSRKIGHQPRAVE